MVKREITTFCDGGSQIYNISSVLYRDFLVLLHFFYFLMSFYSLYTFLYETLALVS